MLVMPYLLCAEERPLVVDDKGNSVRLDIVAPVMNATGGE